MLGKFVSGVTQTPQVWLDCQVVEDQGGLYLSWDIVDDMFPPGLLEAMFAAYSGLLERLALEDSAWDTVAGCRLPADQLQRRQSANDTRRSFPTERIHDAFVEQARAHPERWAVIAPDRRLTYGELHQQASALAARLQTLGAGPNQLIGVVLEKGWEQVVGTLAVVMAGAAYLPIAPHLPARRIRELLESGEVRLALRATSVEVSDAPPGIRWLTVASPASATVADVADRATPDDLAYVIFTSGSTGVPKGVMIDHRAAANTIRDINTRFQAGPATESWPCSALDFDLSVYDLFGLLGQGGTIVVPDSRQTRDPGYLAGLLVREGITIWNSVPSYLQLLLEACRDRTEVRWLSLRLVLLSGDWVPVPLPDRLRQLAPSAQVISLGGATEAAIWSILYPIGRVDPALDEHPVWETTGQSTVFRPQRMVGRLSRLGAR